MKTIGLIGGMSWESTVSYYRIINEKVKEKNGRTAFCKDTALQRGFCRNRSVPVKRRLGCKRRNSG